MVQLKYIQVPYIYGYAINENSPFSPCFLFLNFPVLSRVKSENRKLKIKTPFTCFGFLVLKTKIFETVSKTLILKIV